MHLDRHQEDVDFAISYHLLRHSWGEVLHLTLRIGRVLAVSIMLQPDSVTTVNHLSNALRLLLETTL